MTYWISSPSATFGVVTDENFIVIDAAPIAHKSIGRHIDDVLKFYKSTFHAQIEKLND